MKQRSGGFTLIEILVAMVIVAIIGVLAYGGLHGLIREREQTAARMQHLRLMQQAFAIMTRDFSQLEPRPVRDPLGGMPLAAFISAPQNQPPLVFTRGGWGNPLADVRSTEERVAYQLDNDQLLRLSWPELDVPAQTQPVKQVLLANVTQFDLRFMDNTGQWQTQWPPLNVNSAAYLAQLPHAVEIDVTLKDLGRITRIVEVASP
ncbi:MAG: type II secretion system minor pseudopilin GspJ [Gammaproteobacteria bacterium]|nr:type II secretion system minor pseudopilin GspJ [Gammaproteobacteria bacterium]MBU6508711.1 type II secretion system minor pseudopilin GspJ [Gammaproteobacteria bacterium]MDE1982934.1 type II secretion system minor pseudopilin GspJ [Gammaproteobacteria bacterium]